ncbi:MAG: DUF983 domain-containing protein [Pseudomonadota bacterium]
MSYIQNAGTEYPLQDRKLFPSMMRGLANRCPNCGKGKLIKSGLKVEDTCDQCTEELYHHRADDLPAYLNIFIVGHIVVAATMFLLDWEALNMWELIIAACFVAIAMSFLLMRPLKGMVVGCQWAMRMHGFGGHDD